MMPEPRLPVFPGGGRVTIIHRGRPGPTTFEVAWRNPTPERLEEIRAFWKLVNGHVDAFWFNFAGTLYDPCHFEPDSLKRILNDHDRSESLVVRFRGTKASEHLAQKPVRPEQKVE